MTYAVLGTPEYKYGDTSRLYGLPTEDTTHWSCEVDWDGDGVYTGESENSYMIGFNSRRGRRTFLEINSEGVASGFEPVRVGTASVTLDNTSRRFDPYNTASPLYPNVQPGRYIRIKTSYLGTEYPIIHGKITNISVEDTDTEQTVTLEIEDGLRLLQLANIGAPLTANVYFDAAISTILDDANWPTVYGRNIQPVDSVFYPEIMPWWWADGKAIDEIRKIVAADIHASFFVAANGNATFYPRRYIPSTVATLTSADFLRQVSMPQPQEAIRNYVKVYITPGVTQAQSVLWTLMDTPVVLSSQGSVDIWAQYYYSDQPVAAINIVTPVSSSDYTMNSAADGSGTDLTADFVVSYTDFGKTGKFSITNNSGMNGYITLLQVRGQAVTFFERNFMVTESQSSQDIFGQLSFVLDNPFIQSNDSKWEYLYRILVQRFDDQTNFLTVSVEGRPDIQFTPDLMDNLDITIAKFNISGQIYGVSSIEHEWLNENGNAVKTTWNLEPQFAINEVLP